MTKRFLLVAAALAGVVGAAHAQVVVGDTFTFDYAGFNSAGTSGFILGGGTAVFGTTSTLTGGGVNGQNLTITSSEVVGATTTTDTFTLSTPTNFLTTTKVNNVTISSLQFEFGDANSGVIPGTPDLVNLQSPISTPSSTGFILYGTANTNFTLTPGVTVSPDGLSYSAAEGVNVGTGAISTIAVHQFTMSVTYANPVPEPAAFITMGIGVVGLLVRRRRNRV